jgi:rhodanese-related sulfurtransferase
VEQISVTDLAAQSDATILDVREIDEFQAERVDGALNIPLSAFLSRIDEVPRDTTVYVMCAAGMRSAQATAYLEEHGYDAVNVDGGIHAWTDAGLPVEN